MGEGGLRFHIAGFPVAVPLGGILGVLLIAYLWTPNFSQPGRSGIVLAVVFAVLLYAGVLVHELAHAWAARAFGYPVHGITLWLLGGYTVYERRTSRPWPELVIAVIGPVSTLLLAGLCWVLAESTTGSTSLLLGALAWTNGLLGILNLLPGAPLDGGGVVKSLVWRASGSESTGAKAAGYAGLVIAVLLGVLAVWSFSRGGSGLLLMGVLAIFIGFGALYMLLGFRLIDLPVINFDALDRLTRAFMVWYNDPPKLASIGFSLPPLGTLVLVPFAAIKGLVTSGLALPKPLLKAFDWPAIRSRITVDGVVTLADAEAVAAGRFAPDEEAVEAQRAGDVRTVDVDRDHVRRSIGVDLDIDGNEARFEHQRR